MVTENRIAKVDPKTNLEYIQLKTEIDKLCLYVTNAVVNSAESEKLLVADVNLSSKLSKSIETLRTEGYTKEINAELDRINAAFNELKVPIKEAKIAADKKITAWKLEEIELQRLIDEENRKVAAEAQRLADEENRRIAEAHSKLVAEAVDLETGERLGDDPPEPEYVQPERVEYIEPVRTTEKTSTDQGSATLKMVGKWEEADFSQVDDEYKILNDKKINAMVKAGARKIPGLKIWEEPETSFRSR